MCFNGVFSMQFQEKYNSKRRKCSLTTQTSIFSLYLQLQEYSAELEPACARLRAKAKQTHPNLSIVEVRGNNLEFPRDGAGIGAVESMESHLGITTHRSSVKPPRQHLEVGITELGALIPQRRSELSFPMANGQKIGRHRLGTPADGLGLPTAHFQTVVGLLRGSLPA